MADPSTILFVYNISLSLSPENLNNTQAQSTSIQQQLQPTQYSQKKSQTDDENASRSINEDSSCWRLLPESVTRW